MTDGMNERESIDALALRRVESACIDGAACAVTTGEARSMPSGRCRACRRLVITREAAFQVFGLDNVEHADDLT